MVKIMRKNKKVLLAVFGALLMVMFLFSGPQNPFMPDPAKEVLATAGGREITREEMGRAETEVEALRRFRDEQLPFAPDLMQSLGINSAAHWLLLSEEAQRAGLVGDKGDGLGFIPKVAQATVAPLAQGIPPDQLSTIISDVESRLQDQRLKAAGATGMSLDEFDMALAKLQGVVRLRGQYYDAVRISDKRGVSHIKQNFDAVIVDGLLIPADRLTSSVPEPTEEQVQAHWAQYKDAKAGSGEFGFGYIQPARVKFEYLELNRADFRSAVTLDPVEVSKYYLQNRAKYPGDEATEAARVREDLLNVKVDQLMNDAERVYSARLKAELRNIPQDGAFKRLPEDWNDKGLRLSGLAEAIREGLKGRVSPTVTIRNDGWFKVEDLGREPGVGNSTFRVGTATGDLEKLVGSMRELNAATGVNLQARVPFDAPLINSDTQNRYYINVLDWRAESAAESIEEVRADVVRDLKRKAAYDRLTTMAEQVKSEAVAAGLDKLAADYATPAQVGSPDPTPRPLPVYRYATVTRQFATGDLNHKEVRDAVMQHADNLGVELVAAPENLPARTLTTPVPAELSLAVVQILGHKPITTEDLRTLNRVTYSGFAQRELSEHTGGSDPFSWEAVQKRAGWQAAKSEDEEQAEPSGG